jgi:MurNAc alpha-1-phosphate uridylyltransferase
MRPLTDHTPKPLLQVGGKPLIVWHIENLVRANITHLVINHAHLGEQIEATLGDGSRYGAHIRYSPEHPAALETAGGIAHALHLLGDKPFAVVNGDIWCDYDFAHLPQHAEALANSNDTARLVLVNNPPHNPHGDFHLRENRLLPTGEPRLTFSGIGLYKPGLFASLNRNAAAPLAPLLRHEIAAGRVGGEHYAGRWIDVGTPQRLDELDKALRATHNSPHD